MSEPRIMLPRVLGFSFIGLTAMGIWYASLSYGRLETQERKAEQQERWISEQTRRIEQGESVVTDMKIANAAALAEIRTLLMGLDRNLTDLKHDLRRSPHSDNAN